MTKYFPEADGQRVNAEFLADEVLSLGVERSKLTVVLYDELATWLGFRTFVQRGDRLMCSSPDPI